MCQVLMLSRHWLEKVKDSFWRNSQPLVLKAAAETKLPLIISTGMCSLDEVRRAVPIFRKGTVRAGNHPSLHYSVPCSSGKCEFKSYENYCR